MLSENIRIALRGLSANKLRAALTMLGILIGVAAVITLLSLGDGVTRYVADQFSGLGTNLIFVIPVQEQPGPPGDAHPASVGHRDPGDDPLGLPIGQYRTDGLPDVRGNDIRGPGNREHPWLDG